MAFVLAPFCRETTNGSSGTAVLSLGGVPDSSYQTFVAGVGNGNTTEYAIREAGVGWIECLGTVASGSPATLTRIGILGSSNGGGDVTFGSSVQVYGIVSDVTLNALAGLASLASLRIASNITGGAAAPTGNTLTAILDAILGSTRGEIPYRGSSAWAGLSPGKAGYTLQLSSNLDPTWVNVASGGKGGTTGTVASAWQQAANRATTVALPPCTYSNGSSGVGATLTATANGALSIDGATVSASNRILVKDQASAAQNGIYTVTTVGSAGAAFVLTRVSDYDQTAEIVLGTAVLVLSGTENAGTAWVMTTGGTVTIGTTAIEWDSLTAALPDCTQGQVLGNSQSFNAPAVPTSISSMLSAASYAGQPTITTLGTIVTGVWNGTAIANANLANSTISGISLGGILANLTATDTTLTFSGTYNGGTARTIGLNLANPNTWTKGQATTPVTGGSVSGTVTPDADDANDWTYTLSGNLTIANPLHVRAGQTLNFLLTQDGTGSRTITLGSSYKFAGGTLPTWSTVAGRSDFLSCRVITSTLIVCSAGINVS